jgi:hypothetical protein
MRRLPVLAFVVAMVDVPGWADTYIVEVTSKNIDQQPYVFGVRQTEESDSLIFIVTVRPRDGNWPDVHHDIGGNSYPCQKSSTSFQLSKPQRGMKMEAKDGAFLFRVPVEKGSDLPCFYWWSMEHRMPGGEIYWFRLDPQLFNGKQSSEEESPR